MGHAVGEQSGQDGVHRLHVIDDGDAHPLTRGYHVDGCGEGCAVEEVLQLVGHTGGGGRVLDDLRVQSGRYLVGGLGARSALTAVAATVFHGHTGAVGQVGRAAVVEPQRGVGHRIVQVQRSLHGDACEADAPHVDLRAGTDSRRLVMDGDVRVGIDLHVQLRQGMAEGEGHLLPHPLRMLHVEPGQSDGHRLRAAVLHLRPAGIGAHAPAQVDALVGIERGDVLHDRVAHRRVAREARDAPGGVLHAA